MSESTAILILLVSFLVMVFLRFPIAYSVAISTLLCLSYMAVLSAALAIKRNAHIRMTAFDRYLPEKVIITLDLIADLAVLALAVVMLVTGWSYATGLGAKGTFISMPWLSKFWQYFPIPLAGLAMIFFEVERIVLDLERYFIREEEA